MIMNEVRGLKVVGEMFDRKLFNGGHLGVKPRLQVDFLFVVRIIFYKFIVSNL